MGHLASMSGKEAGRVIDILSRHGKMTAREAADLLDNRGKDDALFQVGFNVALHDVITNMALNGKNPAV